MTVQPRLEIAAKVESFEVAKFRFLFSIIISAESADTEKNKGFVTVLGHEGTEPVVVISQKAT